MTENFHTPIPVAPVKPPADSETFNGPLGELDAALTDHENRIGDLEGEFAPKSNNPSEYLNGQGSWTVPAGTGDVNGHVIQDEGVSLPQRANLNFVGTGVTVTDEAGGTQVSIPGAVATGVQSVVAGNNVSVDNTDPENPVVSASAVQSVVAGTGISVDATDPENPIVNAVGSGGINPALNWNGGCRIAQRGISFTSVTNVVNNDGNYLIDGAIFLADGSDTCDVSQVADTDFVSGYKIRMDVETANRRFGKFFPVVNKDMQNVRVSGKCSAQFKVKITGTSISNCRVYLLSWTGTADAFTKDCVSAWGSAGADPTFVANYTVENTPANIAVSTSILQVQIENISVDTAGVKNIGLLIIIDDTDAQVGDFFEIGDIKIEDGTVCTDFVNPNEEAEQARCERYLEVISAEDDGSAAVYGVAQCASTTRALNSLRFRTLKARIPDITLSATSDWAFYDSTIASFKPWTSFSISRTRAGCHFDVTCSGGGLGGAGTATLMTPNASTGNARIYISAEPGV